MGTRRDVNACRAYARVAAAAVMAPALCVSARAPAQSNPSFQFGKAEAVKEIEWKAQTKLGFIATSGNSQTLTFNLGASLSRKQAGNKLALDAGAAYARSSVLVFQDRNGNMLIDGPNELARQDTTTANSWFTKLRYDRFFSQHNSAYLSALASADQPAGKDFAGGGQVGYSRQLYKDDSHEVLAEL